MKEQNGRPSHDQIETAFEWSENDCTRTSAPAVETPDSVASFGPSRFFNRELSWLQFNKRVLEEAENERHPLLERLRFLSISASNLDEFYMVRVAGLRGQVRRRHRNAKRGRPDAGGAARSDQPLRGRADRASSRRAGRSSKNLLADAGIDVLKADELTAKERDWLEQHFLSHVFPVLTPIAVDPAHPFPFIPNFGFTLGLELVREGIAPHHARASADPLAARPLHPAACRGDRSDGADPLHPAGTVVGIFVSRLFPGYRVRSQGAFRVLRDSELEIQEEAEDLVRLFESALKKRRRGSVIRLEIEASMPRACSDSCMQELKVTERESFVQRGTDRT